MFAPGWAELPWCDCRIPGPRFLLWTMKVRNPTGVTGSKQDNKGEQGTLDTPSAKLVFPTHPKVARATPPDLWLLGAVRMGPGLACINTACPPSIQIQTTRSDTPTPK